MILLFSFTKLWVYRVVHAIVLLGIINSFSIHAFANTMPVMRVLLSQSDAQASRWTFSSKEKLHLYVIDTSTKNIIAHTVADKSLTIMQAHNHFIIAGKKYYKVYLKIAPARHYLVSYKSLEYEGIITLHLDNAKVYCINYVPLENYLCSVLRSESWPGWPKEVNMAFAIACRSYGLLKIMQARKRNALYDVKNSNIHQTYGGFHNQHVLQQAVWDTKGLVLTYKNKPIDAMFDSCCGGIIPAQMDTIDFVHAPYLKRLVACTYCSGSSLYRWKLEIAQRDLEKILQDQGIKLLNLYDIVVSKKDKAGVVHELLLKTRGKNIVLKGKKLYSFFKSIKSYAYTISKKSQMITLQGKGYGHHLGMCQWGARAMVDHGHNYRSILKFYYPHTSIMKMSYEDYSIMSKL